MPKVLIAVAVAALSFTGAAHAQPNVLLIVTDDQRWDTLPYLPTVQAELVERGVTFTESFTVNPLCCPARASILTGTYAHAHGVWANNGQWSAPRRLNRGRHLGLWLQRAGYRTGLFGKFFNNWGLVAGRTPGWDRWFVFDVPGAKGPYFDYEVDDDGVLRHYGSAEGDYSTDVVAAQADAFVRQADGPWFAYVAPFAPHLPTVPAPRHAQVEFGTTTGYPLEYLRSLLAVDDLVARLLTGLRDTGQLADTVIVFTSDNGIHLGEHGLMALKETPYEESIRVPLVIRYDRLAVAAQEQPALVGNIDLAPTVLELAGATVSHPFEGRSLVPLLQGVQPAWRTSLEVEFFGGTRSWSPPSFCQVRGPSWSYVQYRGGREAFWDLAADPGQAQNLAPTIDPKDLVDLRYRIQRSKCRPPDFEPRRLCTMLGGPRRDLMDARRGFAFVCAGAGNDRVWSRDGQRDGIWCERGYDTAYVDAADKVVGCEIVVRR
jgi:N-acetylglucosamine-6-sulfatase